MVDIDEIRRRVSAASRITPNSGDPDYDQLAAGSLIACFNRLAPRDVALPIEGLVVLEVSSHSGGRLPAHEQGRLEASMARAIAFVGAAITHPDSDVVRLGAESFRQALVYTRPTPTGAIAFLPERPPSLPGMSSETVAELAMARLANILPGSPDDSGASERLLALRQPERRAVSEVADAARPLAGLSLLLLSQDEVVHSTVTSAQAENINDLLHDADTVVTRMSPIYGRLDGMRFSRQTFFLQLEDGPDRQGLVDVDLIPRAKELLDQRVKATLERVVTRRGNGSASRPTYRLVEVEPAPSPGLF
ncbi:hypothetical protein GCM10009554_38830 [Kribbella koreensis]|uniref:GGDEF domain-containing protein n=1 Tax=Kribbella koreensis TaxID=57909 RepID=A0ABP4B7G7_9ACTN